MNYDELPMLKRFLLDHYKNPQIINDYYKLKGEQEQLHKDFLENRKAGKNEQPEGYDPILFKKLKANEKAMKNIRDKQREISEDVKIPASETKKLLRELMEKEIEIAKRALGK